MKLAVIYATKYGHSAKVAREIARIAVRGNVECAAYDVRDLPPSFDVAEYGAAMIVGSVHFGRLARPLRRFVRGNLAALSGMHTAVVSISGSAISEKGLPEAEACVDKFVRESGWAPDRRAYFGGAFSYTKYNFILRSVMKRIATQAGLSSDTKHDHEYTNWSAVDAFVSDFVLDVLAARNESRSICDTPH